MKGDSSTLSTSRKHSYSHIQSTSCGKLDSKNIGSCELDFTIAGITAIPSNYETRKFGREIDTNKLVAVVNADQEDMAMKSLGLTDIRDFLTPVLRGSPVGTDADKKTLESTAAAPIVIFSSGSDHRNVPDKLPDNKKAKKATKAKPREQKSVPVKKPLPAPKAAAVTKTTRKPKPPQAPFAPIFPKRLPLTDADVPNGTTRDAYEHMLNHIPAPNELICICKKPARTYDVSIVHCSNAGCSIRWFHYMCLDRRAKGQARFRTLVCEVCVDEKGRKEQDRIKGRSVEGMVEGQVEMAFSAQEIVDVLSGSGGFEGVVNPYGLGEVSVGMLAVVPEAGSATVLPSRTGYAQSTPYAFTLAHDPDALTDIEDDEDDASTIEGDEMEGVEEA